MKKYALIVAGGSGNRMKKSVPKQFLLLRGKPVLMHTMEIFHLYDNEIEQILILPENQIHLWKDLCKKYNFTINHETFSGGRSRFHSVKNGLDKITGDGIVFIHDGVRPLVSVSTIRNCYQTALEKGNALPVIQVSESIRIVSGKENQAADRKNFYLVQTPQTFWVSSIKKAYSQDYNERFTDDASVLESTGERINLVKGNRENIKITFPTDLSIAETLLKKFN